ncbi:MAG: hypothetical protein Q4G18_10880 [Myroides sp.]|nr:hypothetical protein [Myroides sp.]
MKKITLLLAIIFFSISCKDEAKETSTYNVEETSTDYVEESTESPEVSISYLEDLYKDVSFDEIDFKNLDNITLVEESTNEHLIPMLTLDDDTCNNVSSLKISDLTSGSGYDHYQISSSENARLSALGFTGSLEHRETLIIKDYVRYKNVRCNDKNNKYGIGLRCFIHVKTKNYSGGANLPQLAAEVQMGRASANFRLVSLGFGINGSEFTNIKSSGSFNVENFVDIEQVYDKVLSYLDDENEMVIDPVVLP